MTTQSGEIRIDVAKDLSVSDLFTALGAGFRDFLAKPQYGLFFASFYVAIGASLYYLFMVSGEARWLIASVAGFPLLAPFAAVGLYEVSRRREAGEPVKWSAVLGAIRGKGDEQLIMMGGIVFVAFSFWMIIAHGIFAIFMAESGVGESLEAFTTPAGMAMLAVGTLVGAILALAFYAVTVMSLPMLVDREVDFLTAIITSLAAFRSNRPMLVIWAAIIAIVLMAGMIPAFLGLLVLLPVFGHATWHLYRRTVRDAD